MVINTMSKCHVILNFSENYNITYHTKINMLNVTLAGIINLGYTQFLVGVNVHFTVSYAHFMN